jgi:ferredoxin
MNEAAPVQVACVKKSRGAILVSVARPVDLESHKVTSAPGARPDIDTARCTGCGRCVAACHLHLLSLERQGWEKFSALHETDRCTGCKACEVTCPFSAISMRVGVEHWTAPSPPGVAARAVVAEGAAGN